MPALSITKTYQDGDILTEADLDNIRESIENFFNVTGIDSDNIQPGGVGPSDIGINDGEWLEFGTGNDGRIGATADDLYIDNVTTDKDIVFRGSPSGVLTEIFRVDSSANAVVLNSKKLTGLSNADLTVSSDGVNVATLKQFVPVGSIQAYGGTSAPTGWLLCDGSAVSRTTYADLFTLLQETAGQGDDVTTFNLPDFRGRFLRGRDNGAGNDPDASSRTAINTGGNTGDALFSLQADELKSHNHVAKRGGSYQVAGDPGSTNTINTSGDSTSGDTGGNETRPKNVYVNYIIKY